MTSETPDKRSFSARTLETAASLASRTWPLAARIFPETLQIDENRSYWAAQTPDYRPLPPLSDSITADVAIIGGGFTGTSTAYYLSRRFPEKRIVLLEAATLANGASGRNGGLMLNWVNGIGNDNPELTSRVYQVTSQGIQDIVELIQRHGLPVSYRLDGTLIAYTDPQRAEAARQMVDYHNALGIPEQFLDADLLRRQLNLYGTYGAVLDPLSGQINGAQLVRGLRDVLLQQGVEIYEGTPVQKLRDGATITLTTPRAEVRAKAIVLATNGYTGKLDLFRDAIFPLHSHIFATDRLTPEQQAQLGWRAYAGYSDDLDRIAYASMTTDGHMIFGGGSNASYAYLFNNRTAYPGTPESAAKSFAVMERTLHGYLPDARAVPVRHRWTGTLAITLNRQPIMGVRGDDHNIYYALGYSGHGVTLANVAGQILTDLYSGDMAPWQGLPFIQAPYLRIPPEPFRWLGYQMFTRLTGKSPRL